MGENKLKRAKHDRDNRHTSHVTQGEKFADNKGINRIRKSKKDKQNNGKKKKDNMPNNDLQNTA